MLLQAEADFSCVVPQGMKQIDLDPACAAAGRG